LVAAVAIVLPVRLVALLRVGDEVGEGEAVVGGDEVDARVRSAPALLVEIAGAGEAIGELGDLAGIALPVAADGVAVAPLSSPPPGGEVPHLVAALAPIPRLRQAP